MALERINRPPARRIAAALVLGPALGGLACGLAFLGLRLGSLDEAAQAAGFSAVVFGLAPGLAIGLPVYLRRRRVGPAQALAAAILPAVLGVGFVYALNIRSPGVPEFGRQLFFLGLAAMATICGIVSGLTFWLALRPARR